MHILLNTKGVVWWLIFIYIVLYGVWGCIEQCYIHIMLFGFLYFSSIFLFNENAWMKVDYVDIHLHEQNA